MAGIDKHAAHAYTGAQQRRQGSNVSQLSLSEASQLVRSKKVSPVELTRECLSRIERLNPKLNAFITVTADSALAEARQAEAEIQHERWRGPLHGIPIGLKDLIDTAGVRTTAAFIQGSHSRAGRRDCAPLQSCWSRAPGQTQPA